MLKSLSAFLVPIQLLADSTPAADLILRASGRAFSATVEHS